MLSVHADYPNPGARALLIEGAEAHPVRILQHLPGRARGKRREVSVALLDRPGLASGTRKVTIADLEDANPLDDKERAELNRLERELAGKDVSERNAKYRRMMRLHHRAAFAEQAEAAERRARAAEAAKLRGRAWGRAAI